MAGTPELLATPLGLGIVRTGTHPVEVQQHVRAFSAQRARLLRRRHREGRLQARLEAQRELPRK